MDTWFFSHSASALTLSEAVTAIADRLEADQIKNGDDIGSWPQETDFLGTIVAGMVDAYEVTGESTYQASAQLGGNYILSVAQYGLYPDEALALTRLSDIEDDPLSNTWRSVVSIFYFEIKFGFEDGTYGYITLYSGRDPSETVITLANYTIAAYYVNAKEAGIWRQGLIAWLSLVDDYSAFPVSALGAATWALAKTDSLDETLIDPFGIGAPYWNNKKLKDLPSLLLSHQVPEGKLNAGSFYWRFDHGDGDSGETQISGYTEDTIFATHGLIATYNANHDSSDPNLTSAILSAHDVLLSSVNTDGRVTERLNQEGLAYKYLFAGEMLSVLRELDLFLLKENNEFSNN